jgi:lysozyme
MLTKKKRNKEVQLKLKHELAWKLISHFEGFRSTPYRLPGERYLTIGYGRTGADIKFSDQTSVKVEKAWVMNRIERIDNQLQICVKTKLKPNEMAALISFVYNVGINAFIKSTLLIEINNQNYKSISEQFQRWTKDSDGTVLSGLIKRRAMEYSIWESGANINQVD